jgi:polysaccharide export outer membrane protein
MFRTKYNYPFDDLSKIPPTREYKIAINDNVEIQVNPNKGAMLLEGNSSNTSGGNTGNSASMARAITSLVEYDGTIKLPVLGRIQVKDLTQREAELMMEERYKEIFIDPFVKITITNKRVILFSGSSGSARVMNLNNQNTTLTEAIAMSGGVTGDAKANRIKLIRGNPENPEIYLIDLSTIDGMKKGNIVLQGNDIIYIEPRNDYVINFTNRVAPYFGALSLFILIYGLVK